MTPVRALGSCRVLVQAEIAAAAATSLGLALRQLRRFETDCETCELRPACQSPGWSAALDTAIRDIAEEWGLI